MSTSRVVPVTVILAALIGLGVISSNGLYSQVMPCDATCVDMDEDDQGGPTCTPWESTSCSACWVWSPPYFIPLPIGKEGPYSGVRCDENGNEVEYIGSYPCGSCKDGFSI